MRLTLSTLILADIKFPSVTELFFSAPRPELASSLGDAMPICARPGYLPPGQLLWAFDYAL